MIELDVLFEDNHCLAVNKPAGLLSQGDRSGETEPGRRRIPLLEDALRQARKRLRRASPSARPAGVGGHASGQDQQGSRPAFRAISSRDDLEALLGVGGGLPRGRGGHWIGRADQGPPAKPLMRHVVGTHNGKEAAVDFRVIERCDRHAKLELRPRTGRSHQLRVQLASRGLPIFGDLKYGAKVRLKALDGKLRIALHARQIDLHAPDSPRTDFGRWRRCRQTGLSF